VEYKAITQHCINLLYSHPDDRNSQTAGVAHMKFGTVTDHKYTCTSCIKYYYKSTFKNIVKVPNF